MSNPVQMPNLRLAAQHLAVEAQAALLGHREQILQIDKERQDYESTAFMLDSLPKEGTHEIMVPLGKAAFFPGKLVDTQHCLVRMGDNTHLHSTTGEAAAVLHKRCQALLEKRTMLELELQDLEKKLAVARATLAVSLEESGESADATEGLFDIREEYDEALHGPTATDTAGLQTPESVTDNGVEKPREDTVAGSATAHSPPALHPTSGQSLRRKSVSFADEPNLAVPPPEAQLPQQRGMRKGFLDQPKPKPALKRSSKPAQAPGEATKFLERVMQSDAASQRHVDEGRDAAFSGKVVERVLEAEQQNFRVDTRESGSHANCIPHAGSAKDEQFVYQSAAQTPVKKLSRFKQQRAGG